MIASARPMVAITSTGPITLGRMWRSRIDHAGTPITRAACTYSLFFSASVELRTVRAYCTQSDRPIATTSTYTAILSCSAGGTTPLNTPKISSATRIAGKLNCTSAMRMIRLSTQPPR